MTAPSYARELWRRRDFTAHLALANIESRNASTILGLFWWVLSPLLLAATYYLIIGIVFHARRDFPDYFPFLLSGLFAFYYTRNCLLGSSSTVLSNAKLMTSVRFPRLCLPLAGVLESGFGFLASFVAYFALTIPAGHYPPPYALALPAIIALHTILNLGLGALAARLSVPFRDVRNLLPYVLRLWLYLSPIVYSADQLPAGWRPLLVINPLTPILTLYRWALLGHEATLYDWLGASGWAIVVAAAGIAVFVRAERKFVRYL